MIAGAATSRQSQLGGGPVAGTLLLRSWLFESSAADEYEFSTGKVTLYSARA